MPWTGRAGPNGLVRRGCRERVGWDALGRPSRPEWVGPDGLLRACRLGCLGLDESTRMGWLGGVVVSVSVWMPWTGRAGPNGLVRTGCSEGVGLDALDRTSRPEWVGPCTVWIRSFWFETAVPCPLFPALRAAAFRALFRCLLCLARTSLHPGVAFLCFGLLPSVLCSAVSYASPAPPCTRALPSCASDCCLPCFVSLSPMPRPFLLAPRSLPPVAHGPLLSVHGPALSCSSAPLFPVLRPALSCPSACTLLHPPAPLPTLFCASARFLLLSSLCPRSSPCKRKPPKAWPSGVSGYCRSRITSQEPSG